MTDRIRIVLAVASFALLSVYVLPLWSIELEAPQYPEGLGMVIEVNTIRGQHAGNLESINGLNHYIGMKEIEPDSIPELDIMPWIFAVLIGFGLVAAYAGRRWMLYTWLGLFALIMVGAMIDFYLWGYDYGHNLDVERAIIKVPGMTYQPPVIGTKQMLNITASSWPAIGGWIAFGSFVLVALGAVFDGRWSGGTDERTRVSDEERSSGRSREARADGSPAPALRFSILPLVLSSLLLSACAPAGPQPIHYGEDACEYCRMSISDDRHAAQLVTRTGKVHNFDSVECLAGHVQEHGAADDEVQGLYVTDFRSGDAELVRVEEAFFLHSDNLRSPMGLNLTAFSDDIGREAVLDSFSGEVLAWDEVLALVDREWLQDDPARPTAHAH